MWKHLQRIYSQTNTSRQFELEYEIANVNYDDRDIHSFYVEILKLWIEQDTISLSTISNTSFTEVK